MGKKWKYHHHSTTFNVMFSQESPLPHKTHAIQIHLPLCSNFTVGLGFFHHWTWLKWVDSHHNNYQLFLTSWKKKKKSAPSWKRVGMCKLVLLFSLVNFRFWTLCYKLHLVFGQTCENKRCVTLWPCHLHFWKILRQKKNYGNSNISPCKNLIFKKIL